MDGIDMDDMLAGLQAELAAVQLKESAHKLSERNCIELVMKLNEMGKLDLLTTFNSVPEYVTKEQVELEIEQELEHSGGRVTLAHLQSVINLDIVHVEAAVRRLIEKRRKQGEDELEMLNSTELLSKAYVASVAAELNDLIQQRGQMTLADISKQFSLPVKYLNANIKTRAGSSPDAEIQAEFSGDRFYTPQFVRRNNAQVRGILIGLTKATKLSKLWKTFRVDPKISDRYAKSLFASGAIKGTLSGGTFTPAIFSQTQRKQIEAAFEQQGYFDTAIAKSQGITNLLTFLRTAYPSCVSLGDEFVVDQRVVHHVQGQLMDLHTLALSTKNGEGAFDPLAHVINFDGGASSDQFGALFSSPKLIKQMIELGMDAIWKTNDKAPAVVAKKPWRPPRPNDDGTLPEDGLEFDPSLSIVADTFVVTHAYCNKVFQSVATKAVSLAEEHCRGLMVESVPSTPGTDPNTPGTGDGNDEEYVIIHTSAPSTPNDFNEAAHAGKGKRSKKGGRKGRRGDLDQTDDGNKGRGRKKGKGKRSKGRNDAEDDTSGRGKKGGGKKSRKGRRRGDPSSSDDDADTVGSSGRGNSRSNARGGAPTKRTESFLSKHALRTFISELPEYSSLDSHGIKIPVSWFEGAMYQAALSLYNARCAHLQTTIFKATSSDSRRVRQDVNKHFDVAWLEFAASLVGLEALDKIRDADSQETLFASNGESKWVVHQMLANSPTVSRALALLLCNVGLQLDPALVPASVSSAETASQLSISELKGVANNMRSNCGQLIEAVQPILSAVTARKKNSAGRISSQCIDDIVKAVSDHPDLYIKFPKTSGRALRDFVFKQKLAFATKLPSVSSPVERDDVFSFLSRSLQLALLVRHGAFVQLAFVDDADASSDELFDKLVSTIAEDGSELGNLLLESHSALKSDAGLDQSVTEKLAKIRALLLTDN